MGQTGKPAIYGKDSKEMAGMFRDRLKIAGRMQNDCHKVGCRKKTGMAACSQKNDDMGRKYPSKAQSAPPFRV